MTVEVIGFHNYKERILMKKKLTAMVLTLTLVLGAIQPLALAAPTYPDTIPEKAYYKVAVRYWEEKDYEFYRDGNNMTVMINHMGRPIKVELKNGEFDRGSAPAGNGVPLGFYPENPNLEIVVDGEKLTRAEIDRYLSEKGCQFYLNEPQNWSYCDEEYAYAGWFAMYLNFTTKDGLTHYHNPNGNMLIKLETEDPIADGSYTGKGTAKVTTLFGNWNILTLPLIKAKVAGNNLSLSFRANKIDYSVLANRTEVKSDGTAVYKATEGGRTWVIYITKDKKVTGEFSYEETQKMEFEMALT